MMFFIIFVDVGSRIIDSTCTLYRFCSLFYQYFSAIIVDTAAKCIRNRAVHFDRAIIFLYERLSS